MQSNERAFACTTVPWSCKLSELVSRIIPSEACLPPMLDAKLLLSGCTPAHRLKVPLTYYRGLDN